MIPGSCQVFVMANYFFNQNLAKHIKIHMSSDSNFNNGISHNMYQNWCHLPMLD